MLTWWKTLVPISGVSVVSSFVASHLKEKQFLKKKDSVIYTLNLTNIKPKIILNFFDCKNCVANLVPGVVSEFVVSHLNENKIIMNKKKKQSLKQKIQLYTLQQTNPPPHTHTLTGGASA